MFKKSFVVLAIFLLAGAFPYLCDAAPGSAIKASGLIKVEVIKEDVAIRDQPGSKGKIVTNGYYDEFQYEYSTLYVDPQPVENEGASWYRAYFFSYAQLKYSYDVPCLYVNTKDVRQMPLPAKEKNFLEWFDQGRPPRFNVGDELVKIGVEGDGYYRSAKTKVPIKLYSEPAIESKNFILPAESLIIDQMPSGYYEGADILSTLIDPLLGQYHDMQDHRWTAVIDAESRKVIGWLDSKDFTFPSDILPEPSDADLQDIARVFIFADVDISSAPASNDIIGWGTVTGNNVNCRQKPYTSAYVIAQLNKGNRVAVLGVTGSAEGVEYPWYWVKLQDDNEGWIFGQYLAYSLEEEYL